MYQICIEARVFYIMIKIENVKTYCCEDPSLIENYDKAIADTTQTWDCHHREEVLPCGRFSRDDLKKFGLYYNRPATELIFLTPTAHQQLHNKGVPLSDATKKAISDAMIGIPKPYLKGVPLSEEHRAKLSKKILQLSKSGEFIKEWPSAMEASRQLGIAQSGICRCCIGKYKSAGGYVWEYV